MNHISQYFEKSWAISKGVSEAQIVENLKANDHWVVKDSVSALMKDSEFIAASKAPVEDQNDLSSYHGFLFAHPSYLRDKKNQIKNAPGIVYIDTVTHPYWIDKYKMSVLFDRDPILAQFKPQWNLYSKQYSEKLSNQIQRELGGDIFVIKPRSSFLGNGVILVSKEDLDRTLKYILIKSGKLENDRDKSYNYWAKDKNDSFLVEAFANSDLIDVDQQFPLSIL